MTRKRRFEPLEDFEQTLSSTYNRKRVREPFYTDEADYNTNAKSYYDDLARRQKLFELLAKRIWEYDESIDDALKDWDKNLEEFPHEVYKILLKWLDEGKIDKYPENGKIVYTVGREGDFDTINDAIDHIEDLFSYPAEVEILILNDYVMREQVIIKNRDFHFITITCPNPVPTEITQDIKTIDTLNGARYTPFFHIVNSVSPKINARFKQSSPYNDSIHRICGMVCENSDVIIERTKGFNGFSWGGLVLLDKSNAVAIGGNFSDNGNFYEVDNPSEDEIRTIFEGKGVLVQNSTFTGDDLKANNCGDVGVHVQLASSARFSGAEIKSCGHHAIVVSQASNVTARNGTYTYAYDDNVVCETSSSLDISYSDCSNAIYHNGVIAHRTGTIIFIEGKANNNGGWGIHSVNDGHINAEGATANNNGKSGISTGRLGFVYFRWGKANGNGKHGINVSKVSQVVAIEGEVKNNGHNGISISGGEVDGSQTHIANNAHHGVGCYSGGRFNATSSLTIIEDNKTSGVVADNGTVNIRDGYIRNNGREDVRIAAAGEFIGSKVKTTNTKKPMYVVSSGGVVRVTNSTGYANMKINEFQERGLVMSNSLKQG